MTQDAKRESRGFFHIYKPGQGKWVRWGTVASLAFVALAGAYWLAEKQLVGVDTGTKAYDTLIKIGAAVVWLLLWALFTFWLVNSPKWGEFMIMTESEMRKVSWPSRREVISSTKVVIILTLAMGLLLWFVDIGFIKLFQWVGIA